MRRDKNDGHEKALTERHPFLAGLSGRAIEAITPFVVEKKLLPGAFLLTEGNLARATWLILDGRVSLEIYVPGRGAVPVETVDAGGVVGWSWSLLPLQWHFDARVVAPTRVLELDGTGMEKLCAQDPALGYALTQRLLIILHKRIESLRLQLLDLYGPRGAAATPTRK